MSIILEMGARRTSSALAGDPSRGEGVGVPNRRRRREDILAELRRSRRSETLVEEVIRNISILVVVVS